ncbi:phage terminase small subunit P27 family [Staphylococcus equorum]|uniref:phage terminase small subunit P27 family n=1 Tax=Staphylococcus equorum TaxID=246432 RepID=UPI00255242EC|nr:phage terminase small subunit P27 family [Staphylococcus equorum]MDK9869956.1 phage terminase small subunit P27 family [Staphylococcus equorum]
MASKKLLSQQKTRRTTEVQEELKDVEDKLYNLKPLRDIPPIYLDDVAKEEYKRITKLLQELPIADLDLSLVVAYCQTYSNYIYATQRINEEGMVIETERGTKLSSYYTAQRDSTDRLISLSNKLGLNIDARMKVITPKKEDKTKDEFGEMLND